MDVSGLLKECREKTAEHPALLARNFVTVAPAKRAERVFRAMTFNVLADGLSGRDARKGGFTECPDAALEWDLRRHRLLEEILRVEPDLLGLQEVDHHDDWFAPQLARAGYDGFFQKKAKSPALDAVGGPLEDGCSLFWKADKFKLLKESRHVFVDESGKAQNQLYVVAVLKHVATGVDVLAAVTHLKATKSADGEAMREMQVGQLAAALQGALGEAGEGTVCVVFGDFNAAPVHGEYPPLAVSAMMSHELGVSSAYRGEDGAEPAYTTWKRRGDHEAKHTIDYLFYRGLTVLARLSIPEESAIPFSRLPNFYYPSDHFALAADFEIC